MNQAAHALAAILIACSVLLLGQTLPSVPSTISYQGRLADDSFIEVPDGQCEMSFLVFSAASGGTLLWFETQPDVEIIGGGIRPSGAPSSPSPSPCSRARTPGSR